MNKKNNIEVEKKFQLKQFKEFAENPFIENLRAPLAPKMNAFISRDRAIINMNTGELDDDVLLAGKRKYIDGEQFVKIFVREMDAIFGLSRAAQKVLSYMLFKVNYGDRIHFDMEECLEKTGYRSKTQAFRSLAELCSKEFIAKTKHQFVYWINPKLFYKGDQLVVIREYRKAKREKIASNQLDIFSQ